MGRVEQCGLNVKFPLQSYVFADLIPRWWHCLEVKEPRGGALLEEIAMGDGLEIYSLPHACSLSANRHTFPSVVNCGELVSPLEWRKSKPHLPMLLL